MILVIRIVVAILLGALVTGLLNYFGLLTPFLNGLIGFVLGLMVFANYDGALPWRRP